MADHYIDVFYNDETTQPYQVFIFEKGVITAQCEFSHAWPVAQFCRIYEPLPVLSAADNVRDELRKYDIDAEPLYQRALGE